MSIATERGDTGHMEIPGLPELSLQQDSSGKGPFDVSTDGSGSYTALLRKLCVLDPVLNQWRHGLKMRG